MARYLIDTEEGQSLELELAGVGSRAAAGALDLVFGSIVLVVLSSVLGALSLIDPTFFSDVVLATLAGAGVALPALWQIFFAFRGVETPGKRRLDLCVIGRTGAPATIGQHALRALFLPIEFLPLPLPLGLMVLFAHPESRRLGDLVAGTLVTRRGGRPPGTWRRKKRLQRSNPELVAGYESAITPARLARLGPAERALFTDLTSRAGLRITVRKDLERRLAARYAELFDLPSPESPRDFLAALGKAL